MNSGHIKAVNALRLIALSTTAIKAMCFDVLEESPELIKSELSKTCWAAEFPDLRSAVIAQFGHAPIVWQSSYRLHEAPKDLIGWSVTVSGFEGGTASVSVVQQGDDIHKDFTTTQEAHDWLFNFTECEKWGLLECESEYDFREDHFLNIKY